MSLLLFFTTLLSIILLSAQDVAFYCNSVSPVVYRLLNNKTWPITIVNMAAFGLNITLASRGSRGIHKKITLFAGIAILAYAALCTAAFAINATDALPYAGVVAA
jgi:hypothetical protein